MWFVMMNSARASPTPAFGIARQVERPARDRRRSASPSCASAGTRRGIDAVDLRTERARRRRAPPRPPRSRPSPRRRHAACAVAVSVPTMHGQAEFARDDGGVRRAAALVGDDRGHAPHHGFPVRVGHLRDEHVAGLHRARARSTSRTTRTRPRADPLAHRLARRRAAARVRRSSRYTSATAVRAFAECTVSGRACTMNSSPLTPSLAHSMSIGCGWPAQRPSSASR